MWGNNGATPLFGQGWEIEPLTACLAVAHAVRCGVVWTCIGSAAAAADGRGHRWALASTLVASVAPSSPVGWVMVPPTTADAGDTPLHPPPPNSVKCELGQ